MQESHSEGLAIHAGHESCLDIPQGCGEALTVVRTGGPLSSEITHPRTRTSWNEGERNTRRRAMASGGGVRRSQRTWHVWKLRARESGDPDNSRIRGN
jgi:hypothetical protein